MREINEEGRATKSGDNVVKLQVLRLPRISHYEKLSRKFMACLVVVTKVSKISKLQLRTGRTKGNEDDNVGFFISLNNAIMSFVRDSFSLGICEARRLEA